MATRIEINMSNDEKNAQIGEAVSEYQAAKVDLAHIEEKIHRIFKAYREIGATMDKNRGTTFEPTLENGQIKFGYHPGQVNPADILNVNDLAMVIAERDKARQRLASVRDTLNRLGITGIS